MNQRGKAHYTTVALMLWLAIAIAGFGGWVANIVKLISHGDAEGLGLLIARGIGILVVPLGAVLGFF